MEIETLEPVWNGTLEAAGAAEGLSRYEGRSSLYHSANWERLDALEHGEVKGDSPMRTRGADRATRRKFAEGYDVAALDLLRKGHSYNQVARLLNVSVSVARRVARRNGIDRSGYAGAGVAPAIL